ncbi:MAG: nucleoside hydrolase [Clostridia bacterium]|nr:nucleoside hydrolase [Clostridia bacterium]
MTIHEILADVKSDRVKKVIMDCDAGNEIDDQYAIAYALGCDKLDVIGVSAVLFFNAALVKSFEEGMMESYREILRVLKYVGREDVPAFKGCTARVDSPDHDDTHPDIYPQDSEAVDFIINTANSSDEIVYVIATGAVTNVVSAVAKDPSIKDKICVIWCGANCLEFGAGGEFNFHQDFTGGRYLLNCGVNLILAPAMGYEGHGTQVLREGREFIQKNFPGDDEASTYFRELPAEHDGDYNEKPDEWSHVFWDIGGPAILDCTENAELSVITAPRIRGDGSYALGEDRHEIIYMEKLNPAPTLDRAMDCIKKLIKK